MNKAQKQQILKTLKAAYYSDKLFYVSGDSLKIPTWLTRKHFTLGGSKYYSFEQVSGTEFKMFNQSRTITLIIEGE